jgi:hypothetical protein
MGDILITIAPYIIIREILTNLLGVVCGYGIKEIRIGAQHHYWLVGMARYYGRYHRR